MASNDVTRIAGNIGAMNALYALNNINKELSIHQTRLSSGKKINSAADDPAGLSIATKMQSRSEGLKVALDNIGDAKNLLAVAESGMGSLNDILIQMRNKAEAAASDTMGTTERNIIKTQLEAYSKQINDIVAQTKWNGNALIDGTYEDTSLRFQTGADDGDFTELSGLVNVDAASLGVASVVTADAAAVVGTATGVSAAATAAVTGTELSSGTYSVSIALGTLSGANGTAAATVNLLDSTGATVATQTIASYDFDAASDVDFGNGLSVTVEAGLGNASAASSYTDSVSYAAAGTVSVDANTAAEFSAYMSTVESAIDTVNSQLSMIGSLTGRLTFKEDQISAAQINVEASYNRIMNADMAEEQVNASKLTILQQTATAMLAQANAAPQFLLSLFQ